ncbi:A24 family peptidase [Thiomicrorhabdus hydrogeniphila]
MLNLLEIYPQWFIYTVIGIFGLLFGSFFSMVTWRLPRMIGMDGFQQIKAMSLSRSQCSSCHTDLTWKQLIPVFSWLFYRGKCAHCQAKVSARYLWIELFTLAMTFIPFVLFGLTEKAFIYVILMWFFVVITVIDIEHQLILDSLSLPLLWLGLLVNMHYEYIALDFAVIGAVVGYLSLWIVFQGFKLATGKEGLGFGDFKLFAAIGAWFGWESLSSIILFGSIMGIVWALLSLYLFARAKKAFAFGPFLVFGTVSYLIFTVLRA